jgi:hypothetical protein
VEGIVVELSIHVVVPEDLILIVGSDASVFVAKEAVFGI